MTHITDKVLKIEILGRCTCSLGVHMCFLDAYNQRPFSLTVIAWGLVDTVSS